MYRIYGPLRRNVRAVHRGFGRSFLRQGCPRYSDQSAMQEFDFSRMKAVFRGTFPKSASLVASSISGSYISPEAGDDNQSEKEGSSQQNATTGRFSLSRFACGEDNRRFEMLCEVATGTSA